MNQINLSTMYIPSPSTDKALVGADIYIGIIDLDPEIIANQKTVSVLTENGSYVPVSQPLTTGSGGVPTYNGSPVSLYVDGDYSVKIKTSTGEQAYYIPRNLSTDQSDYAETISDLRLLSGSVAYEKLDVLGYYSVNDGYGGPSRYWMTGELPGHFVDNGCTVIVPTGGDGSEAWIVIDKYNLTAKHFGCKGDGSTDDNTAIQAYMAYVRSIKGKAFFPVSTGSYMHSETIYFGASDVSIEGETEYVTLRYTGAGTGLKINNSYSDPQRERCVLRNITLQSSIGSKLFDFTGGNYGTYQTVQYYCTASGAIAIYGQGSNGAGPYYNTFDDLMIIGGVDRSQIGIQFASDSSGNLADGPNANIFSNIKRGASLSRLIDMKAGTGNLFTNTSGESIEDAMIVMNDRSSSDSGGATSATQNTLVDSTKTWSIYQGDPTNWINDFVVLTSGTYSGQVRRVASNTATTLTLDKPWPGDIGTPSYSLIKSRAVKNMFINIRQEGLSTSNPDCIRLCTGARGNEFSQLEIGSIGSGSYVHDLAQDPTNKVNIGDLMIKSFIVENPGAGATITVIPRSSVYGGIREGSQMAIEWISLSSPNFVASSGAEAVLTADHGGTSVGNGSPTISCKVNEFNTKDGFIYNTARSMQSTTNYGIFLTLTTNGTVNAASDFICTIAYRVQ